MKYTFKTYQHGLRGADAAVFRNGVHVWSSEIVQVAWNMDTDRAFAGRIAREKISEFKQIDKERSKGKMGRRLVYLSAALLLTFASADATSRTPKSQINLEYRGQPNGDYRLFIFASDRALVCEEKDIQIVQQGDAINPLVIECKH